MMTADSKRLTDRLLTKIKSYRPKTQSDELDAMITHPLALATGINFLHDSGMLTLSNATVKAVLVAKLYDLFAEDGVVDACHNCYFGTCSNCGSYMQ
jgi:hypothetical protein